MNNKFLDLITNDLICEKDRLEIELERVVNEGSVTTSERLINTRRVLGELSSILTQIGIWSNYTRLPEPTEEEK